MANEIAQKQETVIGLIRKSQSQFLMNIRIEIGFNLFFFIIAIIDKTTVLHKLCTGFPAIAPL